MPQSDELEFHLSLDVEGFDVGPNGHFAEAPTGLFVGCCDDDITMNIPEGPVEKTLELELWAAPDEMWAIWSATSKPTRAQPAAMQNRPTSRYGSSRTRHAVGRSRSALRRSTPAAR